MTEEFHLVRIADDTGSGGQGFASFLGANVYFIIFTLLMYAKDNEEMSTNPEQKVRVSLYN